MVRREITSGSDSERECHETIRLFQHCPRTLKPNAALLQHWPFAGAAKQTHAATPGILTQSKPLSEGHWRLPLIASTCSITHRGPFVGLIFEQFHLEFESGYDTIPLA